jgi:hypothetical protein
MYDKELTFYCVLIQKSCFKVAFVYYFITESVGILFVFERRMRSNS